MVSVGQIIAGVTERYRLEGDSLRMIAYEFGSEGDCRHYLEERVLPRLRDSDATLLLAEHIGDLGDTGFNLEALVAQVEASPQPKAWEVGETVAEVLLEDVHGFEFPWPTSLDKRTPNASLPGPDLVGFTALPPFYFIFGEAKSSSEESHPPQVVTKKKDGLTTQLSNLLSSERLRLQLIAWLFAKARDAGDLQRARFQDAAARYFSEWPRACVAGVLVRGGIPPDEKDLASVFESLNGQTDHICVTVVALYMPFPMDSWVDIISNEEPAA